MQLSLHRADPDKRKGEKNERYHALRSLHHFVSKIHFHSKKDVVIEDISKKLIPVIGSARFALIIHNLFTDEECSSLIDLAESEGFDEALIHGPSGKEILRKDIRNCGRCIIDDEEIADIWFQRTMQALEGTEIKEKIIRAQWVQPPQQYGHADNTLQIVGINERLRFLRYLPGQYFDGHQDNSFTRGPEFGYKEGETSHLTFLLYLNEKMKGGETRIESGGRFLDVIPKTGSVLIFDHDIFHEANQVLSGKKYCCRTDVMYSTKSDC